MSGFIGSLPPNSAPVVSFIPICDIAESATGNAMEATIGAPFIKIASMDVTNPRILKAAGKFGKPIVLSTGFATLDEIDRAVRCIEAERSEEHTYELQSLMRIP